MTEKEIFEKLYGIKADEIPHYRDRLKNLIAAYTNAVHKEARKHNSELWKRINDSNRLRNQK